MEWVSNVYPIIYAQAFLIQTDRRALATNEWLRVKGCENVYALGDCATIDQRKIMVCETWHKLILFSICKSAWFWPRWIVLYHCDISDKNIYSYYNCWNLLKCQNVGERSCDASYDSTQSSRH